MLFISENLKSSIKLISPEWIVDPTNVIGAAYRNIKLKILGLYE